MKKADALHRRWRLANNSVMVALVDALTTYDLVPPRPWKVV